MYFFYDVGNTQLKIVNFLESKKSVNYIQHVICIKSCGHCVLQVFVRLSIDLCMIPTRCIRMQSVKSLSLKYIDYLQCDYLSL